MRTHPFLRAYMAGITVPTLVLLLIMSADAIHRSYFAASTIWVLDIEVTRLERALIFPMAFVPNLWGLWNAIYLAVHRHQPAWPLGLHGALLVLFLVPAGVALLGALGVVNISLVTVLPVIPFVMAPYYLVWKFVVGFLNREVGIG
jgi:hypothetical protein